MDLKNKKVVVVGLGESGTGAAILLDKLGARPAITDFRENDLIKERLEKLEKKVYDFEIGRHSMQFLRGAELVVKSPGVANNCQVLVWARELGIPIIGEIELAANFCRGKIVAITGTNGKSTTSTLTSQILKSAKKKTVLCGNIGNSFCANLSKIDNDTIVVLEISSFQLEDIKDFRPEVAVILNITQNHLDRYRDFNQYLFSKLRITENQTKDDWSVINYDDINLRMRFDYQKAKMLFFSKKEVSPGAFIKNDTVLFNFQQERKMPLEKDKINLKGEHNLENILAASLVGAIYDIPEDSMMDTISKFNGLEHRFEYVGSVSGVDFINDSKATSIDATRKALTGFLEPVILIAGGRDKSSDFSSIKELMRKKVKTLVLIGEAKDKIKKVFEGDVKIIEAASLEEAAYVAWRLAKEGDCVLLSPMCASFDMFKDFEHRGRVFKETIKRLQATSHKPAA